MKETSDNFGDITNRFLIVDLLRKSQIGQKCQSSRRSRPTSTNVRGKLAKMCLRVVLI